MIGGARETRGEGKGRGEGAEGVLQPESSTLGPGSSRPKSEEAFSIEIAFRALCLIVSPATEETLPGVQELWSASTRRVLWHRKGGRQSQRNSNAFAFRASTPSPSIVDFGLIPPSRWMQDEVIWLID